MTEARRSTRRAVVGGCALGVAVGWNVSNIGAVADQTAAAYGVSLATVGFFTTALFVTHAALQMPAGRAVDRLGARRVGCAALAVLAVANALALVAPDRRAEKLGRHGRDRVERAPGLLRDGRLYRLCILYMASFGLTVVLGNWVVTLLSRASGLDDGKAGAIGSLVLLTGVVSRPLGGWLARKHSAHIKAILAASFVVSAAGTLMLAATGPTALSIVGALLLGFAAGIPFAASFGAAARIRPDAPAAAVAMVNMSANLLIVAGTPLVGATFSLPGDGRIGFAASAAVWLAALLVLPTVRELEPAPVRVPS